MMVHSKTVDSPYCGPIKIQCEGWPVPKTFVIWDIASAGSVSAAVHNAALQFRKMFGKKPEYAFIQKLPRGVENGVEIEDVMLFEAEWMVSKRVVVGWLYK